MRHAAIGGTHGDQVDAIAIAQPALVRELVVHIQGDQHGRTDAERKPDDAGERVGSGAAEIADRQDQVFGDHDALPGRT
jgi:hypothetical protein